MKVTNRIQAWEEGNKIFPTDYEKDEASSQCAGYESYRHPTLDYYNRICDLGCRLEVLTGEYGESGMITEVAVTKASNYQFASRQRAKFVLN